MKILTSAALLGEFDSTFPDLVDGNEDNFCVPGKDLALLVKQGLSERGISVEGPIYREPFFQINCISGANAYQVFCYLHEPNEKNAVWAVDCHRTTSFFSRLLGNTVDDETIRLINAIHDSLYESSKIKSVRWFDELIPFGVFEKNKGHETPHIEF